MSGVAVAALVVAAIAAAVVITMLILNSQQKRSDDLLAQERARTAAAQQAPAQPSPQQQPLILTLPASQPATVAPVPSPVVTAVQPPPSYKDSAPSNAALEIDVTSLLQNDPQLRTYALDVKVTDGTAILSGNVSDEALKQLAGKLAGTVRGVRRVVNDIAVRP